MAAPRTATHPAAQLCSIEAMSVADVGALLDGLGMKKYAPKFAEFAIDGLTVRAAPPLCSTALAAPRRC